MTVYASTAEGGDGYPIRDPRVQPLGAWSSKSAKGAASELLGAAHLMRKGWYVYRCESPAAPFDLAAYRNGQLLRVEVKSVVWPGPTPTTRPAFNWPNNEEWDLLLLVLEDGETIEIATHDRALANKVLCNTLGYEYQPHVNRRTLGRGWADE